eukprot:scaffold1529_cov33-Tisochrysis_lutea.AAC.3
MATLAVVAEGCMVQAAKSGALAVGIGSARRGERRRPRWAARQSSPEHSAQKGSPHKWHSITGGHLGVVGSWVSSHMRIETADARCSKHEVRKQSVHGRRKGDNG